MLILQPSQVEVEKLGGESPSATDCAEWVEEKLDVRLNTELTL